MSGRIGNDKSGSWDYLKLLSCNNYLPGSPIEVSESIQAAHSFPELTSLDPGPDKEGDCIALPEASSLTKV